MSEKRICIRLNIEKYSHRLAYEIYQSIPRSQRSDYIRLAIILMNDRDEQIKRIREMLSLEDLQIGLEDTISESEITQEEVIDIPEGMLDFISDLQSQK